MLITRLYHHIIPDNPGEMYYHKVEDGMYLQSWQDKKLVNIVSTLTHGRLMFMKHRKDKNGGPEGDIVAMPYSVYLYNQGMGGCDLTDFYLKQLKLFRRDNKWTLRLFRGALGFSVSNCYILCKLGGLGKWRSLGCFSAELSLSLMNYGKNDAYLFSTHKNTKRARVNGTNLYKKTIPAFRTRADGENIPRRCNTCSCRPKICCVECEKWYCLKCYCNH